MQHCRGGARPQNLTWQSVKSHFGGKTNSEIDDVSDEQFGDSWTSFGRQNEVRLFLGTVNKNTAWLISLTAQQ